MSITVYPWDNSNSFVAMTMSEMARRKSSGRNMSRYQRIYAMLKRAGHSPTKAAAVVLDAMRGDKHALLWIRAVRSTRP